MSDDTVIDDRPLVSPQFTARLLQWVFLLLFLMATGLLLVFSPENVFLGSYLTATAIVLLASVLPLLPGFRNPRYAPWMLAMPSLDFIAFLVLRSEETGGVTNPMVMILALPAVWVGLARLKIALAILPPIVYAVIIPDMVLLTTGSPDESDADRAIMLIAVYPLAILFAAGSAYAMAEILARRQVTLGAEQHRRATAAQETERLRALMTAVVDTLDVGVVITAPTGALLLMNRVLRESPELTSDGSDPWESFRTTTAYREDRVTPIPPEDTTLSRIQRGERVAQRLAWVGPPTGQQRAISISGNPVHTDKREHLANVIVVSDVTDLVLAIEARDAFIGTVSHELRTPLTTVAGFLELILERKEQLDDDVVEWLHVMERNVERQQLLVRDLLTAAEARTEPLTLQRTTFDLHTVAQDAAGALRKEAAIKDIDVRVTGRVAIGDFDPVRMAQVAENLITNAVRYSPAGGRVDVEVDIRDDRLLLSVRDQGVGIAPEDQAMLFEHFFRSAGARASGVRGAGLGLPIVKAIVDAHGGELTIESELGQGTVVTVLLPTS